MKRSEQLKIKRTEKIERMQAILDGAKEGENARALKTEEQTEYDTLKREVESFDTQITEAEFVEARSAQDQQEPKKRSFNIGGKADKHYNVAKAIREFAIGGANTLTGIEAESHLEMARSIDSTGLLIPYSQRDQNATSNADLIDVAIVPGLSIIGKEPLYKQMGLTVLEGIQGNLKIGKKAADVAAEYAEKATVTQTASVPEFLDITPVAFGITDIFTKELLAQENPKVHQQILADMVKGIDRKLTSKAYAIALAAATEVSGGQITEAGFNAMAAAIDIDGAFAMDRESFFAAKAVKFDAGSGIRLAKNGSMNGIGEAWDGTQIFYSTLFADGANKQYVVYGAWSEIWAGFWGALEILINPYTYQKTRQIEVTVNKLGNMVCRNSAAFVKSPDLDATT